MAADAINVSLGRHAVALAKQEWGPRAMQPLSPHLLQLVKSSPEAQMHHRWHIVHCVGKQDQYALDWLKKLKFETYYPGVREMRPVPRKQLSHHQRQSGVVILRPRVVSFFPRYMFVRFDMGANGWREIFKFAGVAGMVCEGDLPVWVPDALIESIRMREVDGAVPGKTPAHMIFAIGDHVRVTDGPFASFPGVVEEIPDKAIEDIDSESRIKVLVNIFGRPTRVSLEINQVGKLD